MFWTFIYEFLYNGFFGDIIHHFFEDLSNYEKTLVIVIPFKIQFEYTFDDFRGQKKFKWFFPAIKAQHFRNPTLEIKEAIFIFYG